MNQKQTKVNLDNELETEVKINTKEGKVIGDTDCKNRKTRL